MLLTILDPLPHKSILCYLSAISSLISLHQCTIRTYRSCIDHSVTEIVRDTQKFRTRNPNLENRRGVHLQWNTPPFGATLYIKRNSELAFLLGPQVEFLYFKIPRTYWNADGGFDPSCVQTNYEKAGTGKVASVSLSCSCRKKGTRRSAFSEESQS